MTDFLARLKQRKLVQWSLAYLAFAFALIQVVDVVADSYDWPHLVMHLVFGLLVLGFVVMLVLAWYHGERGAQRISGPELLLIALALAIGGGLLWHFGRTESSVRVAKVATTARTGTGSRVAAASSRVSSPASAPSGAVAAKAPPPAIAAQAIPAKSIAVLPFENLSTDKGNAYFADGMQDLILTKLADIGDLKVIARTSTEQYASRPADLKTIARQLGVATLLEGSVQKAGREVLINVQLIDATTDAHIWAESYTRTLDNIFSVEGEVAQKVANALSAQLSSAASKRLAAAPTTDQAALDLFLRAEYLFRRAGLSYNTDTLKQAIPLYREAYGDDPEFALARARLSMVESRLAYLGGAGEDVAQLDADALTQATRALALNPELPEAHLALGMSDYYGRRDYTAALNAFAKALALRPNDAGALADRGAVQRRMGRFDDAIASQQRAVELNPRDTSMTNDLAATYALLSRYQDAEQWYRRALALNPDNVTARHGYAYAILYRTGDVEQALSAAAGDDPQLQQLRARLLVLQRKYAAALALLDQVPADKYGVWGGIKVLRQANVYRLMGDAARATPLFKQALPKVRAEIDQQTVMQQIPGWGRIASIELGLGQTDAGLAAIAKSLALARQTHDDVLSPGWIVSNARLYAEANQAHLAIPLLAEALTSPGIGGSYSAVMLWLDPAWDPIRRDPRFQTLLNKYAKYKPAVTYDVGSRVSPSSTRAPAGRELVRSAASTSATAATNGRG